MEAPPGRGAESLWKSIALMLLSFMACAVFMGLPAGAKLTGEHALRIELQSAKDELRRLRSEHDLSIGEMKTKIDKIDGMATDLKWLVDWIKAAGRK